MTGCWTHQDAKLLYNVNEWSDGFFDVNEQGEVVVNLSSSGQCSSFGLADIAQQLKHQELTLPLLLRFPDIIHSRIESLNLAFAQAKQEADYAGEYTSVFPIKVNQQYSVVHAMVHHPNYVVGLEAGSKAELLAIMSLSDVARAGPVICNGYKDKDFIRLALMAQKMGYNVFIILEKYSELFLVLEQANALDVTPQLGIRIRSTHKNSGKWQKTSGETSKFGLTPSDVLSITSYLQAHNLQHVFKVLHFHFGSQISNIYDIQANVTECVRYYLELRQLGMPIEVVDVGGGLGVDYAGSHTREEGSMNYSMQEYANNIVFSLKECCENHQLPQPHIITESGRALTAHHAVLLTEVIDVDRTDHSDAQPMLVNDHSEQACLINELVNHLKTLSSRTAVEAYHDACYVMQQAHNRFLQGQLNLAQRSKIETLYIDTCYRVRDCLQPNIRSHRSIIDELNEKLATKLFVNFSVFQSLPDSWAINQVFPIMPLSGLNNVAREYCILHDITCDSDGTIKQYVSQNGLEPTILLPRIIEHDELLLGVFLVGAYQEILGDMHNLFGEINSVDVVLSEKGQLDFSVIDRGDSIADVLSYVHFEKKIIKEKFANKIKLIQWSDKDRAILLQEIDRILEKSTYYSKGESYDATSRMAKTICRADRLATCE